MGDSLAALRSNTLLADDLENGAILYFPHLHFVFTAEEQALLSPDVLPEKAKNISYDSRNAVLKAFEPKHMHYQSLRIMLQRYADFSNELLATVLPHYQQALAIARTSYRPIEVAGRAAASFRKDDSRLHIDAFPASPNQGRQLLRVFSNVNPAGVPRVWRVGEPFEQVVQRFKVELKIPSYWYLHALQALRITRGLRTPYDALMLQLHDAMKADSEYQKAVAQQQVELTGTWIVFTDQVSHAAMSGQYCLEQTFMLPICARQNVDTSPLKILEAALDKKLV
jgi:hypothetical protein